MTILPDAATLAELVSNVTSVALGTTFVPASDEARGESICGRMVILPIPGPRDINLVVSFDNAGARALGAALRRVDPRELTQSMIDDSVAELLNMVAGQVQIAFEIDQPLGLPRATSLAEISEKMGVGLQDSILLTCRGLSDLRVWVFETSAPSPVESVDGAGARRGKISSLFRRMTGRHDRS